MINEMKEETLDAILDMLKRVVKNILRIVSKHTCGKLDNIFASLKQSIA